VAVPPIATSPTAGAEAKSPIAMALLPALWADWPMATLVTPVPEAASPIATELADADAWAPMATPAPTLEADAPTAILLPPDAIAD